MEYPYKLDGYTLERFKNEFDLIRILLENQEDQDTLVFDLAWLPTPMHRELFVKFANNIALRKTEKIHGNPHIHTRKRYSHKNLEKFITYMGYGKKGMGTQYTTTERASAAQAKESYTKAMSAMIKEFNTFALNKPRNTLGHGLGRPISRVIHGQPINYNNDNYNNDNNDNNERGVPIRINNNNNNIPYGKKPRGLRSSKHIRKGSHYPGIRKVKHTWVRHTKITNPNNNNKD